MRGRCAECGFDAERTSVRDSVDALRSFPRRWRAALTLLDEEDDAVLRRRPSPTVWSALEYLAHTRDAVAVNGWGMAQALQKDDPVLDWPEKEEDPTADPISTTPDAATGLAELTANLERVVAKAERTDAGDWRRGAVLRGGRDEEVDALWFLHAVVHEGSHHLKDVHRVLQQVRAGAGR